MNNPGNGVGVENIGKDGGGLTSSQRAILDLAHGVCGRLPDGFRDDFVTAIDAQSLFRIFELRRTCNDRTGWKLTYDHEGIPSLTHLRDDRQNRVKRSGFPAIKLSGPLVMPHVHDSTDLERIGRIANLFQEKYTDPVIFEPHAENRRDIDPIDLGKLFVFPLDETRRPSHLIEVNRGRYLLDHAIANCICRQAQEQGADCLLVIHAFAEKDVRLTPRYGLPVDLEEIGGAFGIKEILYARIGGANQACLK